MPNSRQAIPSIIPLLQEQELQQEETQRYQQGLETMAAEAAKNPDGLIQTFRMQKGGYLTPALEQKKAGTSAKAPTVRSMIVTTSEGQQLSIPHQYDPTTGKWNPIPDMGGTRYNPNASDIPNRYLVAELIRPLQAQLTELYARVGNFQRQGADQKTLAPLLQQIREIEGKRDQVFRDAGVTIPGSAKSSMAGVLGGGTSTAPAGSPAAATKDRAQKQSNWLLGR